MLDKVKLLSELRVGVHLSAEHLRGLLSEVEKLQIDAHRAGFIAGRKYGVPKEHHDMLREIYQLSADAYVAGLSL